MSTGMEPNNKHIDPVGLLPKIFSGEATSEEQIMVNEWLTARPENRNEYESFKRLWNITNISVIAEDIDIEHEWQRIDSRISAKPVRKMQWLRITKIAASIVLIAMLTYFGIYITNIKSVKAPESGLAEAELPDGTVISLNAGSKITYGRNFGLTHRDLVLKGEAFFKVKKGRIPFIIDAGDATIRVTGTQFNVKAYNRKSEIKVTVTEGTVELYETDNPLNQARINAGETGSYEKSVRAVRKVSVINENDLSWKTLILDFKKTPLIEAVDIISNTYHFPVEVDDNIKKCSITVRFENQNPDSVLNVLKSTLDLTITQKGKRILISGKGC
jgi:ferric-dicitrate binding protein FerR (iron transport regulator)